jgi:hypothetical protein
MEMPLCATKQPSLMVTPPLPSAVLFAATKLPQVIVTAPE